MRSENEIKQLIKDMRADAKEWGMTKQQKEVHAAGIRTLTWVLKEK